MNSFHFLAPAALLFAALAGCQPTDPSAEANDANFTAAVNTYLARRGDLCVGRTAWPVVVTREEFAQGSRNSLQLPVLEKLHLVSSELVTVDAPDAKPGQHTQGRRYQLTEAGRQYFLPRPPHLHADGAGTGDHDFCTAKLTLHKVVRWDPPKAGHDGKETVVSYTYDIAPAPWTADPEARRVFPVIDRMVRGAGVLELKEAMVLTPRGWEARDL